MIWHIRCLCLVSEASIFVTENYYFLLKMTIARPFRESLLLLIFKILSTAASAENYISNTLMLNVAIQALVCILIQLNSYTEIMNECSSSVKVFQENQL